MIKKFREAGNSISKAKTQMPNECQIEGKEVWKDGILEYWVEE
jgi:hypothetical protein